ncbi:MAG: serine/threonine protein kinase [Candidatus Obscuribacterales bacterium]|nr:serine/threonine protein kinase [Candidatus Obscuribacterales bacterium]
MTNKPPDDPNLEKTVQEEDEEDRRLAELKTTYHEKLPAVATGENTQAKDIMIGKVIGGHYKIIDVIGDGGMSRVYLALHMLLDRPVAIKYIHHKFVYDLPSVKRFQQEAKAATALKHPNICAVNEFGIDGEGRSFLVMDYVQGTSLSKLLEEKQKLPADRAIDLLIQVSHGLEHAHSKGVIHRDIKPGNIVIVNDGGAESVMLVDFGIAKLIRDDDSGPNLTKTGEIFGTPSYMSPEQCLGKNIDTRSDIYSLGCVLHELITGRPPFTGDGPLEVLMAHVNDEAPLLPITLTQAGLRDVVAQALRKDPSQRYHTVKEFREDLTAIKGGAEPSHLVKPARKALPRTMIIIIVVIALLVIAVSILRH